MSRLSPLPISPLLALGSLAVMACGGCVIGDIDLEGQPRFGSVSSVLLLDATDIHQYWTYSGSGPSLRGGYGLRTLATLSIFDRSISCDAEIRSLLRYGAESQRLLDAYAEGRFCEAAPAFFTAIAEGYEGEKMARDRLSFYRYTETGYAWGRGTFELGPAGTTTFSGELRRREKEESPEAYYRRAAESWDVAACALDPEFWTWAEEQGETLPIEAGILEITGLEIDDEIAGTIDGDFEGGGSVSGRFIGEWCELPKVDVYVEFQP